MRARSGTTHPFTDGDGRVGRAPAHTVLARRGPTRRAVLPLSLVPPALRDEYVQGLTRSRFEGPAGAEAAELVAAVGGLRRERVRPPPGSWRCCRRHPW